MNHVASLMLRTETLCSVGSVGSVGSVDIHITGCHQRSLVTSTPRGSLRAVPAERLKKVG